MGDKRIEPKKAVAKAIVKYGMYALDMRSLKEAVAALGYDILRFGHEIPGETERQIAAQYPEIRKKDAFTLKTVSENGSVLRRIFVRIGVSEYYYAVLLATQFGAIFMFGEQDGLMTPEKQDRISAEMFGEEMVKAMNRGAIDNYINLFPGRLAAGIVGVILAVAVFAGIVFFPNDKKAQPILTEITDTASDTAPPAEAWQTLSDPRAPYAFAPIADGAALPGSDASLVVPHAVTPQNMPDGTDADTRSVVNALPGDTPEATPSGYFATASGTKYHADGCSYIKGKDNLRPVSVEDIAAGKYTPCSKCIK